MSQSLLLARASAFNLAGSFAGRAFGFLFTFLLARLIGPKELGLFWVAFGVFSMATAFAHAGFSQCLLRFLSAAHARRRWSEAAGALAASAAGVLAVSTAFAALLWLNAGTVAWRWLAQPEATAALQSLSLALPFAALSQVFLHACLSIKEFRANSLVMNILDPVSKVALLLLFYRLGAGPQAVILAVLGAAALDAAAGGLLLYRAAPAELWSAPRTVDWGTFFKYFGVMQWGVVIAALVEWSDSLLIGRYLGPQEVGYYGVALRLAALAVFARAAITPLLSPLISAALSDKNAVAAAELIKTQSRWEMMLMLPGFLGLALYGREILGFFGLGFSTAYPALLLILGAMLLNTWVGAVGEILNMSDHYHLGTINVFFYWIVLVAANIFLIPRFGLLGAGIAYLAGTLFIRTLTVMEVYNLFKVHPFDLWALKAGGGALACLCAASILPDSLWLKLLPFAGCAGWLWAIGLPEQDRFTLERLRRHVAIGLR